MTNHDANSMQQLPLFDLVIAAAWGSKNKFAATYLPLGLTWTVILNVIGSVIEWLESHDCDQHGLGSKPTWTILLCLWERHLTVLYLAWWSQQAVLNFHHNLHKTK